MTHDPQLKHLEELILFWEKLCVISIEKRTLSDALARGYIS